jgi:hypothetical protein
MRSLDTYEADLTKGHGDFVATDARHSATNYEADGFHLLIRNAETWTPVGLDSPTSHTVLSVEITAAAIQAPAGAAFGPYCREDLDHGYEFVVDAFGNQALLQGDSVTGLTTLARTTGASLTPGHAERLKITCTITGSGDVKLGGYVNGHRTIAGTATVRVSEFRNTGFAGHTAAAVPAEWRVTKFWRRGPDDMPPNTPR